MPVPYISRSGIAYPDDLKLLKQIYDEICGRQRVHAGSPVAEELAKAAMELFAQGVFDEAEIRESLRKFIERTPVRQ